MVLINNGIDEDQNGTTMMTGPKNIYANLNRRRIKTSPSKSVHLSDIVDEVKKEENPKQIVLKFDIKQFKCTAFLESPKVLEDEALIAIVMELHSKNYTRNSLNSNCPNGDLEAVHEMLERNGFVVHPHKEHIFLREAKFSEGLAQKLKN